MNWSDVGSWLKSNGAAGTALVGSLLVGNVPGAVAAGVSLIGSATGTTDPAKALEVLQQDPQSMLRLKELALEDDKSIRSHIENMTRITLEDKQAEHHETQETIRNADRAEDRLVRWTRPGQSWASLVAAVVYIFISSDPDLAIVSALLTLPWAYAGLRQVGKGIDAVMAKKAKP